MTIDLRKKYIGKKKSTRKRNNAVKVPVTQMIDTLDQNSSTTKNKVPQTNMNEMINLSQILGVLPSFELNALANQGWCNQPIVSTPSVLPYQGFALKWVNGTTFTRCYGCGMEIPNPPKIPLEELVIVSRDYRDHRHRLTGQIQYSSNSQNVHFHLSVSCVLARCNNFVPANVVIPNDFLPYLSNEHKEIIGYFHLAETNKYST